MSVALSFLDRPVFGLSDDELFSRLDDIVALERRLAMARLETVREMSGRGLPAKRGYANPTAFLRAHLKIHQPAAAQMHTLAGRLPNLPDVGDALAKGAISEAQAAIIASTINDIAAEATPSEQDQAVAVLISQAQLLAPRELAICGERILRHVAPGVAEERERRDIERKERTAFETRAFSLTPDGHGRYRLRGSTTAEGAALLHAILDPLTHPRRHAADFRSEDSSSDDSSSDDPGSFIADSSEHTTAGAPCDHASAGARCDSTSDTDTRDADTRDTATRGSDSSSSATSSSATSGSGSSAGLGQRRGPFADPRNAAQRRHDALIDAFHLLLSAGDLPEHGGSKPHIAVTAAYDTLTQQLTAGSLDTGAHVSAAEVRKISCDAGILPAILDANSVPLDLGRERRLITGSLRKALNLRDQGCAFPGCDRSPRWCQAHHCIHWSDGGGSSLANSVLLCSFHHHLVHHESGWTVHIGADKHPWFTPPKWLDPQQTPRRNLYHHRA